MVEPTLNLLTLLLKSFRLFHFDALVAFGDGFSDDGHSFLGDKHGFAVYCDGPIWSQYLGSYLGVKTENYAYSGAYSDQTNWVGLNWSGVSWQVDEYIKNHNGQLSESTLFAILTSGTNDGFNSEITGQIYVDNINYSLSTLLDHGAKHVLIFNMMDSTSLPGFATSPTEKTQFSTLLTSSNKLLVSKIEEIESLQPDAHIYHIDIETVLAHAVEHHGLIPKILHKDRNSTLPGTPFNYAFFNDWHPSTVIQHHMAMQAYRELSWKLDLVQPELPMHMMHMGQRHDNGHAPGTEPHPPNGEGHPPHEDGKDDHDDPKDDHKDDHHEAIKQSEIHMMLILVLIGTAILVILMLCLSGWVLSLLWKKCCTGRRQTLDIGPGYSAK